MSCSAVKQRHCLWSTMMGVSEGGHGKVVGSGLFVGSERATAAEFTKHKATSSSLRLY